ncbi:MAG: hypothetical protein WD904_04300 [Dehalococcoidia bacterium]
MILHIGGASTGTVLITVIGIFLLIFAMSFAIGPIPEGKRRYSRAWCTAWLRASTPRLIIAGTFSALVFTGSALSGDGKSDAQIAADCESAVTPLTGNAVTEPRLLVAISGTRDIATAARNGDPGGAQTLFFTTDAHNVTHDIDAQLRLGSPTLAQDLCISVVKLENEIAGDLRPAVIATESDKIAGYLDQASDEIDFAAEPSPVPGASGVCAYPIGAVSDRPLTEERLRSAIAAMREVSALAGAGDVPAAAEAFGGDAHNITHDIDLPLRNADPQLGVDLCESVLELELEFGGKRDAGIIAAEATTSAGLLEDSGRVLGLLR